MNDKFNFLRGKLLAGRVYPEFFSFKENDCVLNIGCGEGAQAIVYAGQFKEMIGVDINERRLEKSKEAIEIYGVKNYKTICANVEEMPLPSNSFNKAIAIDIIEHVQNPQKLCQEANRLLKDNGEMLITFPAMHDKFTGFVSRIGRFILRKKKKEILSDAWNPDDHNQKYSLDKWISIVEDSGFKFYKSRATTLFPPLHLYGMPRFWFSNNFIHKIDSFLSCMPILKNYGQSLICIFKKKKLPSDIIF